jgi:hypothetical protein
MNKNKYDIFLSISVLASVAVMFLVIGNILHTKDTTLSFKQTQLATVGVATGEYDVLTDLPTQLPKDSSSIQVSILPPESPISYNDNIDGTVTDNYTGLLWKKCPQGISGYECQYGAATQRVWSEAKKECENLNFAGKTGWRLPTLKELQSIVDSQKSPSINLIFGGTDDAYWTGTSPELYPMSKFTVFFSDGSVYYRDSNNEAASRCVHTNKQ